MANNPVKDNGFKIKNNAGFTLIELLVVISITGLLASVLLISLRDAMFRARNTNTISNMRNMHLWLESLYSQYEDIPDPRTCGTDFSLQECRICLSASNSMHNWPPKQFLFSGKPVTEAPNFVLPGQNPSPGLLPCASYGWAGASVYGTAKVQLTFHMYYVDDKELDRINSVFRSIFGQNLAPFPPEPCSYADWIDANKVTCRVTFNAK